MSDKLLIRASWLVRTSLITILLGVLVKVSGADTVPPGNVTYINEVTSTPLILAQANTNYILNVDVTAAGTAVVLAADHITLDLNGHAITYANGAGEYRYGIVVPPHYVRHDFFPDIPDHAFKGANHVIIRNGRVKQGTGVSSQDSNKCHAIEVYVNNGSEIKNMDIHVHGANATAISTDYCNNLNIHHNHIQSEVTVCTNRHQYDSYAMKNGHISNSEIHDNTISGGQGGITVTFGENNNIYRNDISHNALAGNPYGVITYALQDSSIYENHIHTDNGNGLHIGDGEGRNISVYSNIIDVKLQSPTEYAVNGIKTRFYPGGSGGNITIFNNKITATITEKVTGAYPQGAAGLMIGDWCENLNNEYYENDIKVVTTNPSKFAAGIVFYGGAEVVEHNAKVYNNRITSNNHNVKWGYFDGSLSKVNLMSNTLVKGEKPINYHTVSIGYWICNAVGLTFLDTKVENGASLDNVFFPVQSGGAAYDYTIQWYLDVAVKDSAGNPVEGALISIQDNQGSRVFSSYTDSDGAIEKIILNQYKRAGRTYPVTSKYTYYTPYKVTASKDGYSSQALILNMDDSQELAITLRRPTATTPTLN